MRELLLNRKLFKGLLMLLTILFALPQALAQKNYKIKTDGNCKVYYVNELDEVVVTEAPEGKERRYKDERQDDLPPNQFCFC